MTDTTEFDNLRTLHAATTPGEWEVDRNAPFSPEIVGVFASQVPCYVAEAPLREDDAAFIVAAHNELPALLARLDEVTAERDALAAVIDAIRQNWRTQRPGFFHAHTKQIIDNMEPSSVLAAHDTKVRAEILREAADADDVPYLTIHPNGSPILALPYAARGESVELSDWLRARADEEENR